MNMLVIVAIVSTTLSLILMVRLALGPTAADRMVAVDTLTSTLLILMVAFGAFYRRGIYLDIAVVTALLSFIGTLTLARYLEGKI
ncbi:MAG: multicomponent Na+:H+ antiporter subunit [Thermoanaerobacteraceae bacterium]|jgi:multicomponent Na+:H+ antiporter subunit F|nr:multicomponent Na+:H+ antiporter subunit [Thermoanaerobacteraceae bacterium]MDN5312712.1 multicomponent Na+:H+ antiporter subunit [Thermoanaerobacteraceae bacterium]